MAPYRVASLGMAVEPSSKLFDKPYLRGLNFAPSNPKGLHPLILRGWRTPHLLSFAYVMDFMVLLQVEDGPWRCASPTLFLCRYIPIASKVSKQLRISSRTVLSAYRTKGHAFRVALHMKSVMFFVCPIQPNFTMY